MVDVVAKFLMDERRKRVKPSQVRAQLNRGVPSLRAVETRYNAQLQKVQIRINKFVREEIKPLMKETVRTDAQLDPIDALFEQIANGVLEILLGAPTTAAIENASAGTSAVNFKKYDNFIGNLLGFNNVAAEPSQRLINNWVKQNTELIGDVNNRQLRKLKRLFRDSAFTQVRASELAKEINKIFKGARENVKLIAQDQVQKLNGQLDQFKQQNAGVKGYYWRTSRDERVRTSHAAREGNFYLWKNPPPGGHPGQAIRCRCDAEPALETAFYRGKELKEERARIKEQNAEFKKQAIRKSEIGSLKPRKRKKKAS